MASLSLGLSGSRTRAGVRSSAAPTASSSSGASGSTLRRAAPASLAAGGAAAGSSSSSGALAGDSIVLDLGVRLCRIGFSGEAAPRFSLPTPAAAAALFAPDVWSACRTPAQRRAHELRLEEEATRLLRFLLLERLLIDPKGRAVLLVTNALTSHAARDTLASVLLLNLNVRILSFIPHASACTLAAGRRAALVVDIGASETRFAAVAELGSLHLPYRLMSSTRSRRSVVGRLKLLLLRFGKHVAATPASASRRSRTGPVKEEMLSPAVLDDILDRWLLVPPPGSTAPPQAPDIFDVDALLAQQHASFAASSRAKAMLYPLDAPPKLEPHAERSAPATLGALVAAASPSLGTLVLPGWVREHAAEVLFEKGDEDEASLVEAVLELLLHLPIDLRRPLASNILVVGGLCSLPDLAHRLRLELEAALERVAAGASERAAGMQQQPALSQTRVGALASREEREARRRALLDVQPQQGDSSEAASVPSGDGGGTAMVPPAASSLSSKLAGDRWAPLCSLLPHLRVLNDHTLPTCIPLSPVAFAWSGVSLAGALASSAGELCGTLTLTRDAFLAQRAKEETRPPTRPGGVGRGSFMGVVGGLHTGAWGALSAHLGGARSPPARP